jgi:PEP-CTERM motif
MVCTFCGLLMDVGTPVRADVLDVVGNGISGNVSITSDTTLWSLVGGVTTTTPVGNNSKNAILRYYVVASGSNGRSVFSLGELSPSFGGTDTAPYVSDGGGGSLSLIDPNAGASGRVVSNLTNLQIFAATAKPIGPGGQSTSIQLTGLVNNPGNVSRANLQANFTPTTVTVSGDTYTRVPLWTFINPSDPSNAQSQIVVTAGTDGYEVVLSLAELDPLLGGNTQNLLPYADTGADFPGEGVARTIFPFDNKHGRWESNLDLIQVSSAVPEPSTWAMIILGFCGLGFMAHRRKQSGSAPNVA